jgi:glycosyltransferase involved in cell wall biosynthesis
MNLLEIGQCCASVPQLYADTLGADNVVFQRHPLYAVARRDIFLDARYHLTKKPDWENRVWKLPAFLRLVREYDTLHFHWRTMLPLYADTFLYGRKKLILHFHGDDIRNKGWKSRFTGSFDFIFYATPDLKPYVEKRAVWIPNPVKPEEFVGVRNKNEGEKIVVTHITGDIRGRRTHKGTEIIRAVVGEIRESDPRVTFQVLTNLPHEQILSALRATDIFIDQVTSFGTYGVAAVEAMYMGKPVVCSVLPHYYDNVPISTALDGQMLKTELLRLIGDSGLRVELGLRGRAYALRHHHPEQVTRRFLACIGESGDS